MKITGMVCLVAAVALAGCGEKDSASCSKDSDCQEGAQCNTGQQVCFYACGKVGCAAGHQCDPADQQCKGTPVVLSFAADPTSTMYGGNVTLSWNVVGAESVSIDHGVGEVHGSSVPVTPPRTTVFTLTATNVSGTTTAQTTVTVDGPPIHLSYSYSPAVYSRGVTVGPNAPSNDGGAATSYSADPLPPGLAIDSTTGVITGTPTLLGDFTCRVTASNSYDLPTYVDLKISVVAPDGLIAAGTLHTCALAENGVKCWGDNSKGQLGDNKAESQSSAAVQVSGLTGASKVAAGDLFSCALVNGAVRCWGDNSASQLGTFNGTESDVPVQISGLGSTVTDVVAGSRHACALLATGRVMCWGADESGQLGSGTTPSGTPIEALTGAQAVGAGSRDTCAIKDGGVVCWGANNYGQVGNGSTGDTSPPASAFASGSGVQAIARGSASGHTCAILSGGSLNCWGDNMYDQLGNCPNGSSNVPVDSGLGGGQSAQAVATGGAHTCVIIGGGIQCWGENDMNQLGSSSLAPACPVQVDELTSGARAIAAGFKHSCALVGGEARCWGYNNKGQLGDGTNTNRSTPVSVSGF